MEKKSYKKPMANSSKLRVQSILAGSSQAGNNDPQQSQHGPAAPRLQHDTKFEF